MRVLIGGRYGKKGNKWTKREGALGEEGSSLRE